MPRRTSTGIPPHPATYAEIVARVHKQLAYRLAELKRAEKLIRAIEPDLAALRAQNIAYDVDDYSMRVVDARDNHGPGSRTVYALNIGAGISTNSGDRLISGFIARGWIVEHTKPDQYFSRVRLRRPKTQVRILLTGSEAFVRALMPQGTAQ